MHPVTPQEIAQRLADPLWTNQGITAERVNKAKALAQRAKVSWTQVLEQLPKKVREKMP